MRRRTFILIILIALAAVGYLGYTQVYGPASAPTPTPVLAANSEAVIWASGEVIPARWASLGFPIGGQVVALPVAEGTAVASGTLLAHLDAAELVDAVSVAQASLSAAQADLARLRASARPASVAQAEAAVRSAQATRDGAQAQLQRAQAELAGLLAGAKPEEVDAASAALLKAEAALRLAQTEYDKIAWAGNVSEMPQALALQSATLDYNVAKSNYQALVRGARPQEVEAARAAVSAAQAGVSQAQAGVDAAQAALDLLHAGATPEEIAAASGRDGGRGQPDLSADCAQPGDPGRPLWRHGERGVCPRRRAGHRRPGGPGVGRPGDHAGQSHRPARDGCGAHRRRPAGRHHLRRPAQHRAEGACSLHQR